MKRLLLLLSVVLGLMGTTALAQQIYWADGNLTSIRYAPLNGGTGQTFLDGADYSYLAFDADAQMLYYTVGSPTPQLFRRSINGGASQLLLTFDTHNYPRGLTLDPVNDKLYWSSSDGYTAGNGKIRSANLDGSGLQDLVTGGVYPYGIALDLNGGKMFWHENITGNIWRANLDGSQAQSFIPLGGNAFAFSLAIDFLHSKLYWTDPGNGMIGRANLDGSNVQNIAALSPWSLDAGLTLDAAAGTLYWGDTINHRIYASDLDGNNPHVILSAGVNYPTSLVLVPEPTAWTLGLLATAILGLRCRRQNNALTARRP